MWTWFLTYVTAIAPRLANWSSAQLSLLTFFVIASGVIGCAGGGILADRIGRPAVAIGMMSVSGACAALVGFSAQFGAIPFLAISFLWGISVIGDSAQFSAMTSEQADTHLVGTALTVQMAGGFAMTILSIRLIPWIAGEIGWQWVFIFLAPPPLAGAISIFYAAKSGAGPGPGHCSSKLGKRSARW